MISGHGDDIYRYGGIRCNFSSNISPLIDTSPLRQHLAERLTLINHYPEPDAYSLEVLIAAKHGISPNEVLVTSGATDAIYLIAQTLRDEGSFTVKRPTFSEYADACRINGYKEVVGEASKLYDSEVVGEASKLYQEDCRKAWKLHPLVCWLCNPNNPTGEVQTTDTVKELARHHRWLVIDQSYEDYTLEPLLSVQNVIDMQNVIVIHSMTKRFAIPGLRLGYITAPSAVIDRLRANYRPWAVNALAIEAGCYLLQSLEASPTILERLLEETARLRNRLREISGIHVYPTSTNFMLCSIQQSTAAELKEYLLAHHGFLIRDASNFEGLNDCHFRIATQLPEYNDELVEAIQTFVNKIKRNA
jgi:threonine-phosphate decarboxylase